MVGWCGAGGLLSPSHRPIAGAVAAVDGDANNIDGMRKALEAASFPSVRGAFTIGTNHFPVQNFYSRQVVKDSDGVWTTAIRDVVLKDHADPYAGSCKMKR